MGRILTLSGPSGSGKTTLAGMFIERMPHAAMVTSYTTRTFRESDLHGEYAHISAQTYDAMVAGDEFLWTAAHGDIRYGTMAGDIDAALRKLDGIGIMILVPDVMPALRDYLRVRGALDMHVPVYLVVPDEDVLMRRLIRRGDARKEVERRLWEARLWKEDAMASSIPYAFIRNNGPIEAAFNTIRTLL